MTCVWVLGSGGLLGTALCKQLQRSGNSLFSVEQKLRWTEPQEIAEQLGVAVEAFASQVNASDGWQIYWAAGTGTMSSTAEALSPETEVFTHLLGRVHANAKLMAAPGRIALASSAGAIYAGCHDDVITESSVPGPTTAYAFEKLRQEQLLQQFVETCTNTKALVARISTLYGPGQSTGKKQGLLSHLARSILRNDPVQIFVPYDTIRDYITANDAAAIMVATCHHATHQSGTLTKIIASERPATIAEIVSIFRRLTRRAPRIVTSASKLSQLYSHRVQFRSVVAAGKGTANPTTLAIGIAQLMAAERMAFANATFANATVARKATADGSSGRR